jgi:outer membrane protein assembly factor BamA
VAPLPISSPAIGTGIIPALGYIFPLDKNDKISPPSVIGGAGLITNNGSSGFGLGAELFFKEDTYRFDAVYANGNINYNLYGVGGIAGHQGLRLPIGQQGNVFLGEFLRRIAWKFFLGVRFWSGDSAVTIRPTTEDRVPPPPDVGLHTTLRALGLRLNRDTRLNRFYPLKGTLFEFTSDFFAKDLGSKYTFQSYRLTFNKYWSLTDKQVLAYNLYLCGTGGTPPFYANCVYGVQNELRGYEAGRYIDRYMLATQLEYRLALPWRFGFVAFGGIGGVAPGDLHFRNENFLPAGGGGLRYELSKKYHVNLRADIAQGKNGHTFSMGVGEAF